MDWKLIGSGAIINAILTVILSLIFFPISFLGPIIGGFLASYLSKGFEDYDKMDINDGAVVGSLSGAVGGIILGLLFILGFGNISALTGLVSQIGAIAGNILITGYIILEFSIIVSFVLGLIGGIIGVAVKK